MSATTRRRITNRTRLQSHSEYEYQGVWYLNGHTDLTIYDRQITTSEGHAWPKDRGVRDAGGPFDTIKLEYRNHDGSSWYRSDTAAWNSWCEGNNFPHAAFERAITRGPWLLENPTDMDTYAWVPASSDTLWVPGSRFIEDTIPTNPMLDASVSLAELYREGLPNLLGASLLKDRVGFFRGLAGDYLSYQFGWTPIVSDLKAAAKAIMDQESILQQLERDSGRDVHRKRSLPSEVVDVREFSQGQTYPSGIQNYFFEGQPWFRITERHDRRQWFSGCYTYYYEPSLQNDVSRIATEARHLYGLELTPEVVWNLAPWSWLVDWVTNVGTVFHNVSAFQQDGLVLRYGYVMEQNSRTYERVNLVKPLQGTTLGHPVYSRDKFSGLRKMRRKATPYGFGLLESSFSIRQWAILAALGITRAPKSLSP
jgi:hypothetical protein